LERAFSVLAAAAAVEDVIGSRSSKSVGLTGSSSSCGPEGGESDRANAGNDVCYVKIKSIGLLTATLAAVKSS
jgi:hypothetical protein